MFLAQNILVLLASLLLNTLLAKAFDINANNNIVIYWGQDGHGTQQRLSYYCQNSPADVVVLSFMDGFPNMDLNFANSCDGSQRTSEGLLKCPQIRDDIKYCQSQGKKVLLSLGGASGNYGFQGDWDAQNFARTLWDRFGNSWGNWNARPFADAVLDGFDFDIENGNPNGYAALARALRNIFNSDGSKQYYLSAAPQCPFPDASVGAGIANGPFDMLFIQFYNNYCNLKDGQFNWNTWLDFAHNQSPNRNVKLYVGLPASPAAGSGYVNPWQAKQVLNNIQNDPRFGGVMMWDADIAWNNQNKGVHFAQRLKNVLNWQNPTPKREDKSEDFVIPEYVPKNFDTVASEEELLPLPQVSAILNSGPTTLVQVLSSAVAEATQAAASVEAEVTQAVASVVAEATQAATSA